MYSVRLSARPNWVLVVYFALPTHNTRVTAIRSLYRVNTSLAASVVYGDRYVLSSLDRTAVGYMHLLTGEQKLRESRVSDVERQVLHQVYYDLPGGCDT